MSMVKVRNSTPRIVFLLTFVAFSMLSFSTVHALSPNLISNPSIENPSINPNIPQDWQKGGSGANTRVHTYPVAGIDGANAVKVDVTSYTSGDAKWYFTDIPVTPGETYNFSDMYDSSTISYVTLRYKLLDNTYKYPDLQKNIPATLGWTQFQKSFSVPTSYISPVTHVTLFHLIKSVGSITTDAYSLTHVDTHAPTITINPFVPNLVSGIISLSANAVDDVGVDHVDFFIDNTFVGTTNSINPSVYSFDTTTIVDGLHTLYAIAYDATNNNTQSDTTNFQVQNNIVPTTGTILLKVHTINDNGGNNTSSSFSTHIISNGVDVANSPAQGSESGVIYNLSLGDYVIFVDPFVGYDNSFNTSCNLGDITITGGENIECIITMNDTPPPTGNITVINNIINNNGGTKTSADFALFVDFNNVVSGQVNNVLTGIHIVSEITDPDYERTFSGDCDVNGYVTINNGDFKTCIITNDDIQPTPPIPNPNIVPNYSVEIVSNNPLLPQSWQKGGSGTNTRVLSYPVAGYDGVKAVKTEITSYTSGDAKWYFSSVPASSGQQYTFSDYSISTTTSYITMQYLLSNGTYKYQDIVLNITPHLSWTKTTANFVVPTYTSSVVSMTAFHLIKSVGSITTDNYSITTFIPPTGDPNNLIVNPSVEVTGISSMPYGWGAVSSVGTIANFIYPANGYNSTKSVKIDVTSYTGGSGAKWYFQSIPVLGGEEYRYSDFYKSTAYSYVTVQFHLTSGGYQYMDLLKLTPTTTWKKAEDTFLVPQNADSMVVLHVIKNVGSLTTDNYKLKKITGGAFANGMVTLHFDDGLGSVYNNAIPILNSANLKSFQNIITDEMYNNDPTFVNVSQVLEMNNQGHEIGSHTRTHPHLTQIPLVDAINEIVQSKQELIDIGATPVSFFVYPFGDYDDVIREEVINAGYVGARSVHTGYNTKNSDKFALRDQHVELNTTPAQIISYIETAMTTNTWLILEFHDTNYLGDQYSNTPETLQAVVDYIVANSIPVVSTTYALSQMNP